MSAYSPAAKIFASVFFVRCVLRQYHYVTLLTIVALKTLHHVEAFIIHIYLCSRD